MFCTGRNGPKEKGPVAGAFRRVHHVAQGRIDPQAVAHVRGRRDLALDREGEVHVRADQVGPVSVQAPNGVVDLVVDDEAHAVRAARQYSLGVSSACCRAAIDLRRHDVKIRGSYVNHVAGQEIHGLYNIAKNLRASTEATREFVREYDRASDMLTVHRYLAARKAADQAMMDGLRAASAVDLFLRCGDLDE